MLFADLSDFTAAAESMDPEEVHGFLAPLMARLHGVVESFGGTIVNTMGDGFLSVFGAPVAHPDDAERAVRAAFAARAVVRGATSAIAADLHAGVHTGWVFVAPSRSGFDIVGDTVNTASRIAGLAEPGVVLAGESTRALTAGSIRYRERGPAALKGKTDAVRVFEAIETRNSTLERFFEPSFTPLIGREAERRFLEDAFASAVRERSSSVVLIAGAPGVGKSRLASEFAAAIPGATILVGRGIPFGDQIAWLAVSHAVRSLAAIDDGDALDVAREKLWTAIEAALPGAPGEEHAQLVSQLGLLLRIDADAPASRAVPGQFNWEMAAALRRFIGGLAGHLPVVLILEDLQWSDPEVRQFLRWIDAEPWNAPVLVAGLVWEDALEALGFDAGSPSVLRLGSLDRAELDVLTRFLLPGADVPGAVAEELALRSGGNPLFLQEIVRLLREQKMLVAEPERWTLLDAPAPRVPESVHLVVAARIDGLSPGERRLVRDAAVCGAVFSPQVLGALGWPDPEPVVRMLEERGLVFRRPSAAGDDEYGFRHTVIRDVAYDSIPRGERAGKHLAVAEWYRLRAEASGEDPVEILAYHYGQAAVVGLGSSPEVASLAVTYLTKAGDRALAQRALREAESWYRQAIDVMPPRPSRAHTDDGRKTLEALLRHADVLFDLSRYDAAREESSRALEMAGIGEDSASQAEAYLQLARLHSLFGDVEAARKILALADAGFREAGNDSGRARVVRSLADTWRLADIPKMIEMLEEAAGMFATAGDWRNEHFVYEDLAYVHTTHAPEEFNRFIGKADALAGRAGDRRSRAALARTRGFHAFYLGRFEEAEEPLAEAMAMARDAGDVFVECDCMFLLARIALLRGDAEQARRYGDALVRFGANQRLRRIEEEGLIVLASLAVLDGRPDDAEEMLVRAGMLLDDIGAEREMVEVVLATAHLDLARGEWGKAAEGARRYREQVLRYGDALEEPRALVLEARAMLAAGDRDRASALVAKARELAVAYGQPDVSAAADSIEASQP